MDFQHTGISYDPKIESEVWKKLYDQFELLLSAKGTEGIYFDCTNVSIKERSQIIIRALKSTKKYEEYHHKYKENRHISEQMRIREVRNEIKIHIIWFDIPLSQSLFWNNKRVRKVPENVIAQQYMRLEPPLDYEYDTLTHLVYDSITNTLIEQSIKKI